MREQEHNIDYLRVRQEKISSLTRELPSFTFNQKQREKRLETYPGNPLEKRLALAEETKAVRTRIEEKTIPALTRKSSEIAARIQSIETRLADEVLLARLETEFEDVKRNRDEGLLTEADVDEAQVYFDSEVARIREMKQVASSNPDGAKTSVESEPESPKNPEEKRARFAIELDNRLVRMANGQVKTTLDWDLDVLIELARAKGKKLTRTDIDKIIKDAGGFGKARESITRLNALFVEYPEFITRKTSGVTPTSYTLNADVEIVEQAGISIILDDDSGVAQVNGEQIDFNDKGIEWEILALLLEQKREIPKSEIASHLRKVFGDNSIGARAVDWNIGQLQNIFLRYPNLISIRKDGRVTAFKLNAEGEMKGLDEGVEVSTSKKKQETPSLKDKHIRALVELLENPQITTEGLLEAIGPTKRGIRHTKPQAFRALRSASGGLYKRWEKGILTEDEKKVWAKAVERFGVDNAETTLRLRELVDGWYRGDQAPEAAQVTDAEGQKNPDTLSQREAQIDELRNLISELEEHVASGNLPESELIAARELLRELEEKNG